MSTDITKLHEELLRTNEEFKHEVKNSKDNVANIANGMLALQDDIKAIKVSMAETRIKDTIGESKERSPEMKAFWKGFRTGNYEQYNQIKSTQGVTGTSADGGYAVPIVLDTNLTALLLEMSDVRSVAKVVTIGPQTAYIHTISQSNAQVQWEGETSFPTSNAPTLGQVSIIPYRLTAAPEVSQTMIEDVFFDAESWYITEVVKQIALAEGTAFVNGNGSGQPTGFLTYSQNSVVSAAPVYTDLNTITSVANNAIGFQDIYALPYALRPAYRKDACYAMNRSVLSQVMQLKSTTGQPLWQPSMAAGQPALLNGYPVVEFPDMPTAASYASAAALAITFGDFGVSYTVVDRIGTTVLRNPYINPPFVRFNTYKRVGGGLEDGQGLVTLNVTNA